MIKSINQTLVLDSPKKHSIRYNANTEDSHPPLLSIYLSKHVLDGVTPGTVKITVEWEAE